MQRLIPFTQMYDWSRRSSATIDFRSTLYRHCYIDEIIFRCFFNYLTGLVIQSVALLPSGYLIKDLGSILKYLRIISCNILLIK